MKIFITGASGFVGGAVTKHLKNKHEIFAMARSERSNKKVSALGARAVKCDLHTITEADLDDCETVIHCAAFAEEWGSEEDFFNANVKGTENLLKISKSASIKRFIFIGTEAALFYGQDMDNIDETYPYADQSPYHYSRTKGQAERLVLQENSADFLTISLRPRMIWGPGDQSILPSILTMIQDGKFAWVGQGEFLTSTTHVANLVHAIELTLTNGTGGNAYFIADKEQSTMKNFLIRYISTQNIKVSDRSIPKCLARFLAKNIERIWRLFRLKNKPPMVRFTIDIMSAECTVDTSKAQRDLGYQPVISISEGIRTMPLLSP